MQHKQIDTCTQNHRERYSAAITSAGWNTGSNGGEKTSREGGETLASITINYPTPHRKGDSLRNRKHCGGRASYTFPSTITPMHAHTRTDSCTPAYVGFLYGQFHFTWSCDMAMISILSFWIVIAPSGLECCQWGKWGGWGCQTAGRETTVK